MPLGLPVVPDDHVMAASWRRDQAATSGTAAAFATDGTGAATPPVLSLISCTTRA